jgi:hypothetical protein
LPADARLYLEIERRAAGLLPVLWQEKLGNMDRNKAVLEIPRLRSNAFCNMHLPLAAALRCRFILQPSKGLAAGLHTIAVRQFEQGIQVGGITWALRANRKGMR